MPVSPCRQKRPKRGLRIDLALCGPKLAVPQTAVPETCAPGCSSGPPLSAPELPVQTVRRRAPQYSEALRADRDCKGISGGCGYKIDMLSAPELKESLEVSTRVIAASLGSEVVWTRAVDG